MNRPVILFRKESLNRINDKEYDICCKYFDTYLYRTDIPKNSKVLCRYSSLPFYNELYYDIKNLGSNLIQSVNEQKWIVNCNWIDEDILYSLTPKTWQSWQMQYLKDCDGPFIVKGNTKSKKENWNTHMFAKDKESLVEVVTKLFQDEYIGRQDIIIRKYIPLVTYGNLFSGLPITNEWRCFFYGDKLIHSFYYWNDFIEEFNITPIMNNKGIEFMNKIANILSSYLKISTFDIAETITGEWILIEVNDFQMAGLNGTNPEIYYKNLQNILV